MRIENEGGGGRGKKLPLEQKACAEDVGMKNAMGLGRVREYSLKKAELRRECRKLRLIKDNIVHTMKTGSEGNKYGSAKSKGLIYEFYSFMVLSNQNEMLCWATL